jgi:hypothetical protein
MYAHICRHKSIKQPSSWRQGPDQLLYISLECVLAGCRGRCDMHSKGNAPVGLRLVQAAFPTGAMWAAAEAHATWLVKCQDAKLYAPSASPRGTEEDRGSVAVRRCKESGWDELPAQVRCLVLS